MDCPAPMLETERLALRPLTQADFDATCRLLQDPAVMYAYEGPFTREEVQAWLDKQLRRYREDGFGLWAVILKENGVQIGQCGITLQEYGDGRVPEVGYLLCKEYWHRGFATEAADYCGETPAPDPTGISEINTYFKDIAYSVFYGQATPAEAAATFFERANSVLAANN